MKLSNDNKTKRLFIAFTLSPKIISEIIKLQNQIRYQIGNSPKWVSAKNFHITIKFLGDTTSELIPAIEKTMLDIFSSQTSIKITLQDINVFPDNRHPKILWLGVSKNAQIEDTFQKLDTAMATLSFPCETRSYHPHITLARFKHTPENFMNVYNSFHKAYVGEEIISNLTLYESKFVQIKKRKEVVYLPLIQVKV